MAEYDKRIPEKLQLLRIGLGGKDDLGVFAYYPSTQQTNFAVPCFCLAPADDEPDMMDVHGAIEQTMHDLLDCGATAEDLWQVMGLVHEEHIADRDLGEYISVDLGYCIEGDLLGFEKVDPETSDVRSVFTDGQIAAIEGAFDVLPASYAMTAAENIALWPRHPLADLNTGKWRVHLVMPGDHYGRGDVLTYEQEDADKHGSGLPLVEFYDTSSDPVAFPGGQFVSRYYMDTLLGTDNLNLGLPIRDMQALSLDGGVPAWTLNGIDLSNVAAWLDGAHAHLSEQSDNKADEHEAVKEQGFSLKGEAEAMRSSSEALSVERGTDAPQRDSHVIE